MISLSRYCAYGLVLMAVQLLLPVMGRDGFLLASDLRLSYEDARGPGIGIRDAQGRNVVSTEPLVRWNDNRRPASHKEPDGKWLVVLGPRQLRATVDGPRNGEYGEDVFDIELRNDGPQKIAGVLHPPFTQWTESEAAIRENSPEFLALSSNHVIVGTIGAHKAWSAGSEFDSDVFATIPAGDGKHYLTAVLLMQSSGIEHNRERIVLEPGQRCRYELHIDSGQGSRNDALRQVYRVRGGYRVHPKEYRFNHYNDPDLAWAKNILATWLDWAWDEANLNPRTGEYRLLDSLAAAKLRFGGYDAFILWPFWPRAGFDNRSQFDHYRDMPGGLDGLHEQIRKMHAEGMRTFISYCHWSESDRDKSDAAMSRSYEEFAQLACKLDADGALMDLMSKTPDEILNRARECGRKLVPYNEGDPTWSDTQTNLLGRIHNDVAMPEFNLKKYMLPHHPQLRVCEPGNTGKRMRNDFVLSFFNGHGVEINTMFPGKNPATDADWPILSRALDLLRTNRSSFRSVEWEPLIASADAKVWVNSWPSDGKTVFTLCGTDPGGHHGALLTVPHVDDVHYVDLWRYRPVAAQTQRNKDGISRDVVSYDVEGFTPGLGSATGSGDYSPGCIGAFRQRMRAWLDFETLHVDIEHPQSGQTAEVWLGTVDPGTRPVRLPVEKSLELDLYQTFKRHTNETVIVRLTDHDGQTDDVAIIPEEAVRFFRIDKPVRTARVPAGEKPDGMVRIPGGRFLYALTDPRPPAQFPYAAPPFQPTYAYKPGVPPVEREVTVAPFWMDRFPVTNAQFARFVEETGYRPENATNFLKQFAEGGVPQGLENHPVVYVSYADAKAYAAWAGKRLPTEEEWQFAAGGEDGRAWPWGNEWDASRANAGGKGTEAVTVHDSDASPYGVRDLVGNVWQWTASLMDNGQHLTVMLRGGSWYRPPSGRWWVPGGPRKVTENYPLPLDGPAMNRLATVGFRCVKDE